MPLHQTPPLSHTTYLLRRNQWQLTAEAAEKQEEAEETMTSAIGLAAAETRRLAL